jgi:hypothetical protein
MNFDLPACGTICGRVTWDGDIPLVAPFEVLPNPLAGEVFRHRQLRPNPNAPVIDARTRGVANAVVFLRGVDVARARPWNHAPVLLEQRGCAFHVFQGQADTHVGFLRRGEALAMVSRDPFFHSLHAGGAAFFSLAFPDPDQPLKRRLAEKGLVELTSAAGYYWMRAYIFVDEHPYYTLTDAEGRFELTQVPSGPYEVVCWLPNWIKARHERDPESSLIWRHFFNAALEAVQPLTLGAGKSRELTFRLGVQAARRPRAGSSNF